MVLTPRTKCQSKALLWVFPAMVMLLSAVICNACFADDAPLEYKFYPDTTLILGRGYLPTNLSLAKTQDFLEKEEYPVDQAALNTTMTLSLATDSASLRQALGIDEHADASYLVFHGGEDFNYHDDHLFSSNSATLVVSAETEFGRVGLKKVHLTAEAKTLIDRRDMKTFKEQYGDHYVTMVRKGASVHALITVSGISSGDMAIIKAGTGGGGGFGPVSGNVSLTFQKNRI